MERTENESLRAAMKMFIEASSLKTALVAYGQLISLCKANRSDNYKFYKSIRDEFNWWKVKQLWEMLDKRFTKSEYLNQQAGKDLRVLVAGAGPCGLRLAIECAFLGAKVIVLENREAFVRNSLLHLWPCAKEDLKNLGARILYPKFSVGSTTHMSVSSLQLILLKVALLVGIEVYENVAFCKLIEHKTNNDDETFGWKAALIPENHVLADYQFNVLINASEEQNSVTGFRYDDPNDYEKVCKYLSKIKQEIEEESSSSPTLVQSLDQTKSEELIEKPAHSRIQSTEVNVSASIEELKEKEGSPQKTHEKQRWLPNCKRTTVRKADTALQQTIDNNNMQCISRTSSARRKLQPAFLQKIKKLLGAQWQHHFTKRKPTKNIKEVNIYAADSTVVNPLAQHGLQPSTQEIQSIDSCSGEIYDIISKDCSNMRATVKKTSNVINDNSDKVERYKESEKEMKPEMLQVPENNQTPPMVIKRQVIKTLDPALLQSINNLLGPLFRQQVVQQKSKKNPKEENIKAAASTLEYPQAHKALQMNNDQFQSDKSLSRQICGIISTDCSSLGVTLSETSKVNNENKSSVDKDKESEDKMKAELLPIVGNDQKLPMAMEPRVRKPLNAALLQRMDSLLRPVFRQQVAQQNGEFQSIHSCTEQIYGIKSTDCSRREATVKETSNVIHDNSDEVDRYNESEKDMNPALLQVPEDNQTSPMVIECRVIKPLDPAFLQRMNNLLGPLFRQHVTQRNSMQNINEVKITAADSTVVNPLTEPGLQLNNDQFELFDPRSGQLVNGINTDFSNRTVSVAEMIDDGDGDGGNG
ncbi:Protein-methionine sulfoxide oxidase MICAL2 [Trichinella papuae]|uniref:Protein-methionine sulfoxide oxidase MICAL2 n=1 Tax=Trichinella papuae TaxID=268474 RepID=A0A0V1M542_9BILA|nr:Protein-methionine sulfoxide oxidase MICAL2 [Trichinella papuae]